MNVMTNWTLAGAVGVMLAAGGMSTARAGLIGPILPYESFNDSPFNGLSFTYFDLISMTNLPDGGFSVPGVSVTNSPIVIGPGFEVDSVDGMGNNGHSLFSGCGSCGLTFTFDASVLGALPTAAGIAWTDGLKPIHFSAIDGNGNLIGQINDSSGCDFSCGDGNPANYRFFGVEDSAGIRSITISNDGGGIEVDHLQFGLLASVTSVPEPSSYALMLLAAGVFLASGRWRRRA